MIDTLISLIMVFLLLLGILVVDDAFLAIQTAETANFFAARAVVVQKDSFPVNEFFQTSVFNRMIFTQPNKFLTIEPVITTSNDKYVETKILVHSPLFENKPFDGQNQFLPDCKVTREQSSRSFCTHATKIEMPQ